MKTHILSRTLVLTSLAFLNASPCQVQAKSILLVTSNNVYSFGQSAWLEILSTVNATVVINPQSYSLSDFDLVIGDGNVWDGSIINNIRTYLQDGGRLCLTAGTPFFVCGQSVDLTSIQDLIGVTQYWNSFAGGDFVLSVANPYCLPFQEGEILATVGPGSWANVSGAADSLINKVYWQDGALNCYGYRPYSGKYVYTAHGGGGAPKMKELLCSAVKWLLDDPSTVDCEIVACTGVARIWPNPQYIYFAHAICPMTDTIRLGNFTCDEIAHNLNLSSIKVNGIAPTSADIDSAFPGFFDGVVRVTLPLPDFIETFGTVYDTAYRPYFVTGTFNDYTPFAVKDTVTLIGHRSAVPGQFIVPNNVVVLPGDLDLTGYIDIGDAVAIVGYVFGGDIPAGNPLTGDANCSATVDIFDAIYMIAHIFKGGPAPCVTI